MNVLVDTSAWSLAFRRSRGPSGADAQVLNELVELIREGRALLMGPIRQEVLSGISDVKQFRVLRESLRAFSDVRIHEADYERAAEYSTNCRRAGLQGSHVDFLVCAVAVANDAAILSADRDFSRYARHVPIALHSARAAGGKR